MRCFVELQNMAAVTMECLHDLSIITEPVIKDERDFSQIHNNFSYPEIACYGVTRSHLITIL